MFIRAIVITSDGARTDIRIPADFGISDVAQMIDLGACLQLSCFHFDEVPHPSVLEQHCPWSDPGKRPDPTVRADFRIFQNRIGGYAGIIADFHIMQHAIRADVDSVAEHIPTAEDYIYIDTAVLTEEQLTA